MINTKCSVFGFSMICWLTVYYSVSRGLYALLHSPNRILSLVNKNWRTSCVETLFICVGSFYVICLVSISCLKWTVIAYNWTILTHSTYRLPLLPCSGEWNLPLLSVTYFAIPCSWWLLEWTLPWALSLGAHSIRTHSKNVLDATWSKASGPPCRSFIWQMTSWYN